VKKQVKPPRRQTKTGNVVPKAAPTAQTDDLHGVDSPFPIVGIASTERDITEHKRKEEEASRMATVVRDSNDAITIQDYEGKITAWNRGAELMFGYSEQEALKMTIWQLAPPDKAAEQKDFNRRIFAGEAVTSFETQRLTKDGRLLDVWLTVTKLVDEAGKVIGIASTERDITGRKKKEVELAAAQQLYRELFENINVAILRTTPGPEGGFVDMNPAMIKLFEADSREQLMSIHVSDIYWDSSQRKIISDAIVAKGFAKEELKFKTLKGNPLWCHINSVKKTDANGQVYFDSTMEDFTDRKRAEEALSLSNAFLNGVIEQSPESLWVSDSAGTMIRMNRACHELFGVTEEEAVGKYNLFKDNLIEAQGFMPLVEAVFRKGEIARFTIDYDLPRVEHIKVSGGMHRIVDVVIAPIKDLSGKVTNAIIQHKDVTERKQAESQREAALEEIRSLNTELEKKVAERTKELQDSQLALLNLVDDLNQSTKNIALTNQALEATNKELEAFSYSVSHDLRAPLRSINGFSQALLEDYQKILDDEGRNYLDKVRKATQQMGNLIDDMLKLSRVTQSEFHPESIDLSKMVQSISDTFQKNNPNNNAKITIQKGIVIQGDHQLMQIALTNLIENAWKFTGKQKHPHIEFGATLKKGENVFFVRDNGVGFDMAYVDKLFGAFQRLHAKDEFAGTGIGLATVQRIIHRHGGKAWAEGEVGKGATFYFTLPA